MVLLGFGMGFAIGETTGLGQADDANGRILLAGDGLGPLRLGMSRSDALDSGWLGEPQETCSDMIGGGAAPGEYAYMLDGPQAPEGLSGSVEISDDEITTIGVSKSVAMPNGVTFDSAWDATRAMETLQSAGYRVSVTSTFEPEDSATATSPDGAEFGFYFSDARGSASVAIPTMSICD